jgi:hypothetical protein
MPADLMNLTTFFENADAHAAFLHRITAAVVEKAAALRAETPPDPVTDAWRARQQWAHNTLAGISGATAAARAMLPGLAVRANDAGFLTAAGTIDVTDTQIRAVLDDDFVDLYAAYIPPTP